MKKVIAFSTVTLVLIGMMSIVVAPVALAATTCNGIETSLDYHCNDYQTDSISAILMTVINFMAVGVGIAVVAGIAWGGLTYSRSGGDSAAAKEGMDTIRNAIIGLALFLGLWALANFFIPGGAFNLNPKIAVVSQQPSTGLNNGTTSGATTSTTGSFDEIKNFRDASTSGVIKAGVLFRSGRLYEASSDDIKELGSLLKNGTIIDLREASDRTKKPDKSIPGVASTLSISIVGTTNYTKFVNGQAGEIASASFGEVIKSIAHSNGPVLVHCTHGKDRTGWTVAMIMYALGANDTQVMQEYMRSAGQTTGKNVTEEMLNNGLSAVKKKYGSVQKYLSKGLGLTTNDIAALKKKLGA